MLALVIVYSGFLQSLLMFLIIGIIPGTTISVPPTIMLVAFIAISWLLIFRFSITKITNYIIQKRRALQRATHKRNMPKRRLARIKTDPVH